ncbi:Alpha/Beta hydrolase protein [Thelonectria olida]|uniref:Carboxypeptidase n=1 Tax=Thelonectria olida TaxID=1576542 RepID=A0A9P9ASY8_9HYPO|nr:Alpha/Beta hydrolase protein [Thelonectria olida]
MWFSVVSAVLLGLAPMADAMGGLQSNSKLFRTKTPQVSEKTTFQSKATSATLKYVENSGVCETTPGVNQYSGYISLGTNMSMWFWFFEARNDAENAPLALWLNGGPGCSSMVGLFQENGPCHFVNNETEPRLNPHSWNEYANMLYLDQPIGAGFSYGEYNVNSTLDAAPYVWTFLQAFFENFQKYRSRDFGLFTESYGGRYGPEFALHFLEQNDAIQQGRGIGEQINLVALGINNGWIDPKRQFLAYATYAAHNPYRTILNNSTATLQRFVNDYNEYCVPAIDNCTTLAGQDEACYNADYVCNQQMYFNLRIASRVDFNVYDVRLKEDDEVPPETYVDWITREDIMKKIGAQTRFAECDDTVYNNFVDSGDDARNFAPVLEEVIQRNITTLLWAGDLDWICNVEGMLDATNHLDWAGRDEFVAKSFANYTVDGTVKGVYKTVDNVSFMKVYEAGHELPYYQPETALQVFKQIMQGKPLTST